MGALIGDRELLDFRAGYYDLCVSLLWREPSAELLDALCEGLDARVDAARPVHPLLADGWVELRRVVEAVPRRALAEAVADEYTRLFIGPHAPPARPYESYYLAGRLLDRPLAALRELLAELGIEKDPGYPEPEDFLAFELEVMRRLLGRQRGAVDPPGEARCLDDQARFLKRHLLVWGPAAATDLAEADGAAFYRGVAWLLGGFLALERRLFENWGEEAVGSLDERRRRFASGHEWRGPLFDPGAGTRPAQGAG